jgi:hypothetical protein
MMTQSLIATIVTKAAMKARSKLASLDERVIVEPRTGSRDQSIQVPV